LADIAAEQATTSAWTFVETESPRVTQAEGVDLAAHWPVERGIGEILDLTDKRISRRDGVGKRTRTIGIERVDTKDFAEQGPSVLAVAENAVGSGVGG
jgi:hypothetical protein